MGKEGGSNCGRTVRIGPTEQEVSAHLYRYDALHLDHSVSQSFDLLVLHVVLQLHLLEESEKFI